MKKRSMWGNILCKEKPSWEGGGGEESFSFHLRLESKSNPNLPQKPNCHFAVSGLTRQLPPHFAIHVSFGKSVVKEESN